MDYRLILWGVLLFLGLFCFFRRIYNLTVILYN